MPAMMQARITGLTVPHTAVRGKFYVGYPARHNLSFIKGPQFLVGSQALNWHKHQLGRHYDCVTLGSRGSGGYLTEGSSERARDPLGGPLSRGWPNFIAPCCDFCILCMTYNKITLATHYSKFWKSR